MLTFEQQNDLVARGLAKRSDNGNLSTFKYARKVMYDYLWDQHPELLECRGHTYDNTDGTLVINAPHKTFNYGENGTWANKPLSERVTAYRKFNGFMACATIYKGELVVSTTGTTSSNYAKWAKDEISKPENISRVIFGLTSLFEIILPHDPHIVEEHQQGAVLLGTRCNSKGIFLPSMSTISYPDTDLSDLLLSAKTRELEGWMVYDEKGNCCKLKTEYYVGKKKLMRMSKNKVEVMYNSVRTIENGLPNMWKFAPSLITRTLTQETWSMMSDQDRRKFLEEHEWRIA